MDAALEQRIAIVNNHRWQIAIELAAGIMHDIGMKMSLMKPHPLRQPFGPNANTIFENPSLIVGVFLFGSCGATGQNIRPAAVLSSEPLPVLGKSLKEISSKLSRFVG